MMPPGAGHHFCYLPSGMTLTDIHDSCMTSAFAPSGAGPRQRRNGNEEGVLRGRG